MIEKNAVFLHRRKINEGYLKSILAMGKEVNLKVVAEGVETEQHLHFLREHKCDIIQGYHFSKPLLKEEFELFFIDCNQIIS